jgi:hypothetical protein
MIAGERDAGVLRTCITLSVADEGHPSSLRRSKTREKLNQLGMTALPDTLRMYKVALGPCMRPQHSLPDRVQAFEVKAGVMTLGPSKRRVNMNTAILVLQSVE